MEYTKKQINKILDDTEVLAVEMNNFINQVAKKTGKSYSDIKDVFYLMTISQLQDRIGFLEKHVQLYASEQHCTCLRFNGLGYDEDGNPYCRNCKKPIQ